MTKPMHKLWASNKIVELFKMHSQWPNIQLDNNDPFLNMIKDENFVKSYLNITNETERKIVTLPKGIRVGYN